jgi:hypothetical protein
VIKIMPDGFVPVNFTSKINLIATHTDVCFISAQGSGVHANLTDQDRLARNPACKLSTSSMTLSTWAGKENNKVFRQTAPAAVLMADLPERKSCSGLQIRKLATFHIYRRFAGYCASPFLMVERMS